MNKTQRKILVVTSIIIALLVVFPPYQVKAYNGRVMMSGYSPIYDLPSYPYSTAFSASTTYMPSDINVPTLLLEIFSALVVCGLAYFAANTNT